MIMISCIRRMPIKRVVSNRMTLDEHANSGVNQYCDITDQGRFVWMIMQYKRNGRSNNTFTSIGCAWHENNDICMVRDTGSADIPMKSFTITNLLLLEYFSYVISSSIHIETYNIQNTNTTTCWGMPIKQAWSGQSPLVTNLTRCLVSGAQSSWAFLFEIQPSCTACVSQKYNSSFRKFP